MKLVKIFRRLHGYLPVVLVSLSLFCSCHKDRAIDPAEGDAYPIPEQTEDDWETASLSSVGMDEMPLLNLLDRLDEIENHDIHSLLIVKDGKLVFEEYFPGRKFNLAQYTGETGYDRHDTHNLCSAAKSVTSALIGIAIDRGYIESVYKKVFDFFPGYSDLLVEDPEKGDMTVEHLLMMMSGLEWDDESTSYFDPQNDMNRMFNSSDPIRYVLSQDLFASPGTVFDYDNGNTNVLGEIVRQATDWRLDDFSQRYLFSKLGITDFEWQMINPNVVFCSGDLRLRPRDMAKFGQLFLDGGIWNGERVISQDWVDASTRMYVDPNDYTAEFRWADGYGYQWWQWERVDGREFSAYFASGWGGQWIIVWPEMNMVIVSTGGNYYTDMSMPIQTVIADYIIPSISGAE